MRSLFPTSCFVNYQTKLNSLQKVIVAKSVNGGTKSDCVIEICSRIVVENFRVLAAGGVITSDLTFCLLVQLSSRSTVTVLLEWRCWSSDLLEADNMTSD